MGDQRFHRIRVFLRGLFVRCPVCGERHVRRGLQLAERCPRCQFRFERREGQFVGAVGVNTIVTFGLVLITLLIGVALSHPDIDPVPVLIGCGLVAVVFPLLFLPASRTLWTAIDLIMDPLAPGEAPGLEVDRPA